MTSSTDQKYDLAAAMKGAQWERCKGELRALVAMQGSYHSASLAGEPEDYRYTRMKEAKSALEKFITNFADEGYAE